MALPQDSYSALPQSAYGAPSPIQDYTASSALPLEQDPAYLAYVRAAGLENQQAVANYNKRQAALQAALQGNLQQQQFEAPISQRNLAGSYEARGISRSGERLRGQAELATRQQQAQQQAVQNTAAGISNEAGTLASTIAQNNRQAAEAGLDAATRLAQYRQGTGGG